MSDSPCTATVQTPAEPVVDALVGLSALRTRAARLALMTPDEVATAIAEVNDAAKWLFHEIARVLHADAALVDESAVPHRVPFTAANVVATVKPYGALRLGVQVTALPSYERLVHQAMARLQTTMGKHHLEVTTIGASFYVTPSYDDKTGRTATVIPRPRPAIVVTTAGIDGRGPTELSSL